MSDATPESNLQNKAKDVAQQATKRAGELVDQAKDTAKDVAEQATQKAGAVADQAKDVARNVTHNVTQRAGEVADQAKEVVSSAQDALPEQFRFLNSGWWAVHLLAIPLAFALGYMFGQKKR